MKTKLEPSRRLNERIVEWLLDSLSQLRLFVWPSKMLMKTRCFSCLQTFQAFIDQFMFWRRAPSKSHTQTRVPELWVTLPGDIFLDTPVDPRTPTCVSAMRAPMSTACAPTVPRLPSHKHSSMDYIYISYIILCIMMLYACCFTVYPYIYICI